VTGDIAAAAGGCHLFSGCGFPSPGQQDFNFQTLFTIGAWHVTKPELIAILCALIAIVSAAVGVFTVLRASGARRSESLHASSRTPVILVRIS